MSHTKITAVFQKLFLSTTLHWTLSATLKSGPDRKYTHDTALAVLSVRAALTDHDVHDVASGPEIGQRKDRQCDQILFFKTPFLSDKGPSKTPSIK